MKIEMYTKNYCPYCVKAKALLKIKGVDTLVEEINIEKDNTKIKEMLTRSGGKKTVPQIFINNTHVGGCDELYALEESGKLNEMLK